MRMNGIPRSIAERMGEDYQSCSISDGAPASIQKVRQFLVSAGIETWNRARPNNATLSGREYKEIWKIISGEGR